MTASVLLADGYSRIQGQVASALGGLSDEQLVWRPGDGSNSIAWLIWHTARIIDGQIAEPAGKPEVWASGWREKFDLSRPVEKDDTGYGHTSEQVAAVRAGAKLLANYYEAVWQQTRTFLETLSDEDLDKIIDRNWDPPVTLGARLVSILVDVAQHVGQANYLHGLILRQKI